MLFFLTIALITAALAAPAAVMEKSWRRFLIAFVLSFVGVLLPLTFFLLSTFMVPEWKGACRLGWLDGFYGGKLALTPLVLWATAAFYAVEILQVAGAKRTRRWIVLGYFSGALVATICFGFGVASGAWHADAGGFLLAVPGYTAVWYVIRSVQLFTAADISFFSYLVTLICELPLWLASGIWSWKIFQGLPDKASDGCFVVTAASRGHANFVGPLVEVEHRGRKEFANSQLTTLRRFESLWQKRTPRSHAIFRRGYNRFGPVAAAKINSPIAADVAYVALKPVEFAARLALIVLEK